MDFLIIVLVSCWLELHFFCPNPRLLPKSMPVFIANGGLNVLEQSAKEASFSFEKVELIDVDVISPFVTKLFAKPEKSEWQKTIKDLTIRGSKGPAVEGLENLVRL